MYFDYHLHSNFSADSKTSLEDIFESALNKGIKEVAITDHHDIDYKDDQIEFLLDKSNYFSQIEKYQNKYKGKLRIKKGIEIGMQTHILKECDEFIKKDFDFVIASFHTAEKKDLYNGDFFKDYTQWEAYINYLKSILEVVSNYDNYSVIGHLDLIRRYGNYKRIPDLMDNDTTVKLIKEILLNVIKKDKGLEVNTSGYYIGNGKNPMPTKKILKLYKDLGGKIITVGSDSHTTDQIGFKFKDTKKLLKSLGYDKITTYENMKPKFHKI